MTQQLNCDALILGGGLGSRMGFKNKALVSFQGQPLFAHVLCTLRSLPLSGRIYLSLNQDVALTKERYPDLEIFSDDADLQQQGPLGGLLSFYRHYHQHSRNVLVCPCDTPFISRELIMTLYQAFTETSDSGSPSYLELNSVRQCNNSAQTSLVCAASPHGLEPSIMLVETAKLQVISRMQAQQEKLSLKNLYTTLGGKNVFFASTQDFCNLNTIGDLENAGSI